MSGGLWKENLPVLLIVSPGLLVSRYNSHNKGNLLLNSQLDITYKSVWTIFKVTFHFSYGFTLFSLENQKWNNIFTTINVFVC